MPIHPPLNGRTLILRADASLANGMGHIGRCVAMAEAWQDFGGRALLVASGPQAPLAAMAHGVELEWLGADRPPLPADAVHFLQLARNADASVAWLDSYHHDRAFEASVRGHLPLVAVDDLASRRHACDLLVDTSLTKADFARYAESVPQGPGLLLGTDYVVLRRPFRTGSFVARGLAPVRRLLVSFGGTDPHGHTAAALDALNKLQAPGLLVDFVLSRANPALPLLAGRIADFPGGTLHVDTGKMAGLMAASGLALGSGGSTSWERCRAGLPTLMTLAADNQRGVASLLEKAGIVRLIPSPDAATLTDHLAHALRAAMADAPWRAAASAAGIALIDGGGGQRLVEASIRLCTSRL